MITARIIRLSSFGSSTNCEHIDWFFVPPKTATGSSQDQGKQGNMSYIKENGRRRNIGTAPNAFGLEDDKSSITEDKKISTPSRRGRPKKNTSFTDEATDKNEIAESPRNKKKKVDFTVRNDHFEQVSSRTPRRRIDSGSEKSADTKIKNESDTEESKRIRSRDSSISESSNLMDSVSSRSGRNRQPSRRLMESKISEELVKEQLSHRKRPIAQRLSETIDTAQLEFGETSSITKSDLPLKEIKTEEDFKQKNNFKKQSVKTDPGLTKASKASARSLADQPKVTFKTITQQPELQSQTIIPGVKKQIAAGSSTTSPSKTLFPTRTICSKIVGGSTPVVIPRSINIISPKRIEKAKEVPSSSNNKAASYVRFHKIVKPLQINDRIDIMDTSDISAVGAYDDLSHVANEEIVGELQSSSSDFDPEHRIIDAEQRIIDMLDRIKSEPHITEDDDDAPPQLQAEKPTHEAYPRSHPEGYIDGDAVRCLSPGGHSQFVTISRGVDGSEMYIDENGEEVQMVDDVTEDLRTVEFNFLDSKNICCGLCGEIVPYDNLMNIHLPQHHPEVLGDTGMNLEEVPYESWLKDKLYLDKKSMETGFRYDASMGDDFLTMRMRGARPLRKVSQIRVNPVEMDLEQLNHALNKKMIEKMGRRVPVSLVDKQHAKCGVCQAVVSLNKKFEIVHLVRHFNAWHPSAHRCAGTWPNRPVQAGCGKPLSIQDFAVIDVNMNTPDNLQCIWCGMFMDRNALAMHFTEVHPEEIEVPRCLLCMQELVINARLLEKYGEDFEVTLPDEHHVKCQKFIQLFNSEPALDKAIAKRMQKINAATSNSTDIPLIDDDDDDVEGERGGAITNSRMTFGRRNKPKRSFVQPSLRQAVPANSKYVEAVTECQWRCKLCSGNIFGAVISAGAIKHYKQYHPGEMENMQYELCKARLDRVSGGCMEFVHPQLVECLVCNLTYTLHKPYNMCRGIRHLKLKHPDMMPENSGLIIDKATTDAKNDSKVRMGEVIDDPEMVARFKSEYQVEFDKVQAVYGDDNEPVYVLLGSDETLDTRTASQMIQSLGEGGGDPTAKRVVVGPRASMAASAYDDDDVYGDLAEDDELAEMEANKSESANRLSRVIASDSGVEVVEEVIGEYMDEQPKKMEAIADEEILETVEYPEEGAVEEEYYDYPQEDVDYIDEGGEEQYIDADYMVEVEGEEYQDEPVEQ